MGGGFPAWKPSATEARQQERKSHGARKTIQRFGARDVKQYSQTSWSEMSEKAMRYAIVIENAGQNYSAYVPDLPGCIAAADTIEETEQMIREAIQLHIEGLKQDQLPVPKPTSRVDYVEVAA